MKCPACDIEMELLIEGIFQCSSCKKIIKAKSADDEEVRKEDSQIGRMIDGEWFHQNLSLNKDYEIAESGILINKTETRVLAALICHSALLKSERYVRISWWKTYQHAGMLKIYDNQVLNNLIKSLEKFDDSFDELWNWKGSFRHH
ncbi:MAG: hypothetical protein ACTSR5_10015 [Promethearchaeota archaeon]